ncbi:uncharacterized protein LOC142343903 isoform X2 [Convolutriloba macropyga]|uniref:uncharacterized protein LOC142343903 isoform X2 n=1 Tax=Convolutriloba macropyga TaxID=536237 RepID=UPI003F51BEA9
MLGDIERRLSLGKGAKQLLAGDQSQDFEQPVFAELIREIEEKEEEEQLREIGIDGIEGESVEVELEPTIKSEVDISAELPDVAAGGADLSTSTLSTSFALSAAVEGADGKRVSVTVPLARIFRKQEFLQSIHEERPKSAMKKEPTTARSRRERDLEEVPRYVRYRKKHLDDLHLTQIGWVPEIEKDTVQEDNLEANAMGVISEIEKMLHVPAEKEFRAFFRNTLGWVDRYKAPRDDVTIDTRNMESHLEMVAANERAFQIMMEGFEQLESIVHAHDQLIQDRDEHAQIVWSAQEALIRDRKEVVESHFNNIEQILNTIDENKGLRTIREKLETLREIRDGEERDHASLVEFLDNVIKTKDEQFRKTVNEQRESILLCERRMAEQYKVLKEELHQRAVTIEKQLSQELEMFHKKQSEEWMKAADKIADRDREHREDMYKHRTDLIDRKMLNDALEAECATRQKIILIDREVEMQKLLEHLKAKCSAFHQVLENEVNSFDKADENQKNAIRVSKRHIVKMYSQLLKNKEELRNAKFKNLKAFHDKLNHYNQWCRKVEKFQRKCLHIFDQTASDYFHIWLSNEEQAQHLMRKLFNADKLITEWQLGLTYKHPGTAILETKGPPLTKAEKKALSPYWAKRLNFLLVAPKPIQIKDAQEQSGSSEGDLSGMSRDLDLNSKLIQEIFNSVSQELAFFVDERLMRILRDMPDQDMVRLITVDKILGCLGLTSDEDIRRFITFFAQRETATLDELSREQIDERADKSVSAEVTVYVDLGEEFEDFDPELAAIFEGRDQVK